ncbi:Transposon Ty3-I Gag-Pol polyprotein-like protein [Drosera capensis]
MHVATREVVLVMSMMVECTRKSGRYSSFLRPVGYTQRLEISIVSAEKRGHLMALDVKSTLMDEIIEAQRDDPQIKTILQRIASSNANGFKVYDDGSLRLQEELCVPAKDELMRKLWKKHTRRHTPCIPNIGIEHQRPDGILQPLDILTRKWESIAMDFVVGLPMTPRGLNTICVIVDRLTKSAHFLAIKNMWTLEQLAKEYIDEIV